MPTMPSIALHVQTTYPTGTGHIEARGFGCFLVTFYGRRVRQGRTGSLEAARFMLRRLAAGLEGWSR